MKRRAEIIFEIEEVVAIKARRSFTGFCGRCNAFVEMLPAEAAAALCGLSEREIFRLIEASQIHFVEGERVFVCRNSSINWQSCRLRL
jgi:hypothetical protein